MYILPVGSIIKYKDLELLVIGYHLSKENEDTTLFYSVVSWPVGYMNEGSIKIVNAKDIYTVAIGYTTDLSDSLISFVGSFISDDSKTNSSERIALDKQEQKDKNKKEEEKQDSLGNNLLPIGTVVKHKNFDNKSMIVGYFPVEQKSVTVYKYVGVSYPNGITKEMDMVMFNDISIEEVLFIGYQNDFSEKVVKTLKEMANFKDTNMF